MNQLQLSDIELEKRINSFLSRKLSKSDLEHPRLSHTERRTVPMGWKQYAL